MKKYSIKDIEKLSGIKAHTIRIWEKRYNIVEPNRTNTNIRFYSDNDLKRILNIALLNQHGQKISNLATKSDSQLSDMILRLSSSGESSEVYIERLIVAMVEMDEEGFEEIMVECSKAIGFEESMLKVIYPFLQRIGVLWQTGNINPAQEHFMSHLIRQKLIVATDQLPRPEKYKSTIVLFLPVNEMHEIGLLFYNYILRKRGHRVIYLGQHVPFEDLLNVDKIRKPDAYLTFFVSNMTDQELQDYLDRLKKSFPKRRFYLAGLQVCIKENLKLPDQFKLIRTVDDFLKLPDKL